MELNHLVKLQDQELLKELSEVEVKEGSKKGYTEVSLEGEYKEEDIEEEKREEVTEVLMAHNSTEMSKKMMKKNEYLRICKRMCFMNQV